MKPSDRLKELQLELPALAAPIGSYVPANRSGRLIFTSGQLPFRDGKLAYVGQVPNDVPVEKAADGARIAMQNALAAAAKTAGGVDNIERVVRVCVYVNSGPGFAEQPKVANGASDLLTQIFGDAGKHARSAVGAVSLPLNAVVEVELVVETRA
jgi:enamine deaminase RidA (YjgF/YER057c/UK114 family)